MGSRERLVNQLGFYTPAWSVVKRYIETSGFLLSDEYKPQTPTQAFIGAEHENNNITKCQIICFLKST